MPDESPSHRRTVIIVLLLLLLALLALLLLRCSHRSPEPAKTPRPAEPVQSAPAAKPPATPAAAEHAALPSPDDVLTPATLQAPARVPAGAAFSVQWTGPNNSDDFVTIVPKTALDSEYVSYRLTRTGATLELTAPMEPGDCEVRYVAGHAHQVLGRTPITVEPTAATLNAPAEAILGTEISVAWTGPNNSGDYITVVAKDIPDGRYGNFTYTSRGSPLTVLLPVEPGENELRYMTGQGGKVLARRVLRIRAPEVTLSAADEAVAGSSLEINWTGPNNRGDYITIVARTRPDGQHANYSYVSKGAPLPVLVPIEPGEDELRYMTGQGDKVLARRALRVVAARITLAPPAAAEAGSLVEVPWTGPDHPGDYLTIVEKSKPDAQYGNFVHSRQGSPAKITAPKEGGEAEVRYISGQGGKVLARQPINIVAKR